MVKPEEKIYKIGNDEFTFEKPCIKLTEALDKLSTKYEEFENEDLDFKKLKDEHSTIHALVAARVGKDKVNVLMNSGDDYFEVLRGIDSELSEKVFMITSKYNLQKTAKKKSFLNKPGNMKLVLETCLNVGERKIDFNVSGDLYLELEKATREVFEDFFFVTSV